MVVGHVWHVMKEYIMFKAAVSSYHSDDNKMEEIDRKCSWSKIFVTNVR